MKYIKVFVCFILFFETGCSSPSSQSPSDKKTSALPSRNVNRTCDVSQAASDETQSIIWQAIWDEDGQIIGLKNDFDAYYFSRALSVEGKDFDIVASRAYLRFPHDRYDRYFNNPIPILYVKFLDDSTMQVELHTIDKTNFEEVHKLASKRNNSETLADYPTTKGEGCYDVIVRKMENTSIPVDSQGEGWRKATQIEDLFQDRDLYLTLSYGIYKSNASSSTEEDPSELLHIEETSFYMEFIDSTDEGLPNIEVIFKGDDVELNDFDSVRPSIKGLGSFNFSVDLVSFRGVWNDFSDEIFNNRISQVTLNPFEFVFGFSGGQGSEQMDFTISITQDTSGIDTQ